MASRNILTVNIKVNFIVGVIVLLVVLLFFTITVHFIPRRMQRTDIYGISRFRAKLSHKKSHKVENDEEPDTIANGLNRRMDVLERKLSRLTDVFLNILDDSKTKNERASEQKSRTSDSWTYGVSNVHHFFQENMIAKKSEVSKLYRPANKNKHRTRLVTTRKCSEKIRVLILVPIAVKEFEHREVIRTTWGVDHSQNPRWRTYFLLGKTINKKMLDDIEKELEESKDLVLGNIHETSKENTFYKTLMGIEWAATYCPHDFLLISNYDVFINTRNLLNFLDNPDTPSRELYGGFVFFQAKVRRVGEYAIEEKDFPNDIFPRYCSAAGYIMSQDVVHSVYKRLGIKPKFYITDMYIGLLVLKSGVDAMNIDGFKVFQQDKKCPAIRKTILYHPVTSRNCMAELYEKSMKN